MLLQSPVYIQEDTFFHKKRNLVKKFPHAIRCPVNIIALMSEIRQVSNFEAKGGHFEAKGGHFEAKGSHFEPPPERPFA
jgi:hypothetical protein